MSGLSNILWQVILASETGGIVTYGHLFNEKERAH